MGKSERGSIDRILDEAAADAEAGEDDLDVEFPAHVKITRGGPRTRVLQVRLNDDELAALEALAESRGLPPSTVVRELILNALNPAPAQAAATRRLVGEFKQYLDTVRAASYEGTLPTSVAALVPTTPTTPAPRARRSLRKTARRRGK
jgi:Ribbon-helix-helix protein, copG family